MDPMGEEQLDYGDELHHPSAAVPAGAIHAPADDEIDDEFDDLYSDVNVGETFVHSAPSKPDTIPDPDPNPPNGWSPLPPPNPNPNPNPPRAPDQLGFQPPQAPPAPAVDPTGPTMLFVGELHWWTTDAEIEDALSRYGRVKEVKFFDERASGKSKGYCQVEFHDAAAAAGCKEGMDGLQFNGRSCVITFASPQTLRQMGASYANNGTPPQARDRPRPLNDANGRGDGSGRNFSRGGWGGRGGQGMMNHGGGGMNRGRGFNGGRGMMNAGCVGVGARVPYGAMMHPQGMMGAGFDPTFMGVGGFPTPAFTGMMPPFQAMNAVGLPGVAPHVNPAFFGRGMNGMGGMGMIGGGGGMDGQMWGNVGMGPGGWMRESSNGGDDGGSEYGYGDERGARSNVSEKDGYRGYRSRDRDYDNEDDRDRGQSASRSRSRMTQEDDHRSRSRDADYGKRRCHPSE